MLVKLRQSRMFDTNPAIRFAEQYKVDQNLWTEMWKRYKVLEYSIPELAEYFQIKCGKQIRKRQINRWIFLTDIFIMTKPARDMKAEVISTEMFGVLENKVIEEITRHLKSGGTKKSYIMV